MSRQKPKQDVGLCLVRCLIKNLERVVRKSLPERSQGITKNSRPIMGMTAAFRFGLADFSGIDGSKYLYISAVLHKAYVDVSEEGTEAAAATAIVGTLGAAPGMDLDPIIFLADHPFIFLIKENLSGSILFIGRLVNPEQ